MAAREFDAWTGIEVPAVPVHRARWRGVGSPVMMDELESRRLFMGVLYDVATGYFYATGDGNAETVNITQGGGLITVNLYNTSNLATPKASQSTAAVVVKFFVDGLGGNDNISVAAGITSGGIYVPANINCGSGNDTVVSGSGNDTVHGDADDDNIFGGAGNDVLTGDDGIDYIWGDTDDDWIDGGAGDDELYGDGISGGYGSDVI